MTAEAFMKLQAARSLPLNHLLSARSCRRSSARHAEHDFDAGDSPWSLLPRPLIRLLGVRPSPRMAMVFPMAMMQQMLSAGAMGGGVSSRSSAPIGAGEDLRAQALALHAFIIAPARRWYSVSSFSVSAGKYIAGSADAVPYWKGADLFEPLFVGVAASGSQHARLRVRGSAI